MIHRLRSIGQDQRGLALVEFAIALPIMLILYLGGWQLSDAIACNRKVTITARTVADLISQYAALPDANIQGIIGTSTQVLAPYNAANATVVVSQLYTDTNGNTKVDWSDSNVPAAKRTPGTTFALPASMVSKDTYLVYSEVTYSYTPTFSYGFIGPITMGGNVYMSPRISNSVSNTG